jgi:hypothetical protein
MVRNMDLAKRKGNIRYKSSCASGGLVFSMRENRR